MTLASLQESGFGAVQEHVLNLAPGTHYLPAQRYVRELWELAQWFSQESHSSTGEWCILIDGRCKEVLNCPTTIDDCIAEILGQVGISAHWLNASRLLGLSPDDLHASGQHLPALREALTPFGSVVVLGSGSLTDLAKHALLDATSTRLFSIPTALTVTAFTSAFSVLEWNGAKSTRKSRRPDWVVWVEPFLGAAPRPLSQAGFGDLMALSVAQADWFLLHSLGLAPDYTCVMQDLVKPFLSQFTRNASAFSRQYLNSEAIESTAALLSLAGIGMSLAGATTPVSGYEHAISHGIDFLRTTANQPLLLHGLQVGLTTAAASACLDTLLAIPNPSREFWHSGSWNETQSILRNLLTNSPVLEPTPVSRNLEEGEAFHRELRCRRESAREHFELESRIKNDLWCQAQPELHQALNNWRDIVEIAKSLSLRAHDVASLLLQAGIPLAPEVHFPALTANELRWAMRFAPFVRARPHLGDVAFWMGEDPVWLAGL